MIQEPWILQCHSQLASESNKKPVKSTPTKISTPNSQFFKHDPTEISLDFTYRMSHVKTNYIAQNANSTSHSQFCFWNFTANGFRFCFTLCFEIWKCRHLSTKHKMWHEFYFDHLMCKLSLSKLFKCPFQRLTFSLELYCGGTRSAAYRNPN